MRKLIVALFFLFIFICLIGTIFYIPSRATQVYGPPARHTLPAAAAPIFYALAMV